MLTGKSSLEDFGSRLRSLGGRISYNDSYKSKYVDLEEFFLDATTFIYHDSRLANNIENWIQTFGFIISPSKVKNLIKNGYKYDPAALAVLCEIISKSDKKQISINCLKEYFKKKAYPINRNSKVRVITPNPLWKKYNVLTPSFKPDTKKYLLDFEYILKNVPEISNRIYGIDIVAADYQAYLTKEGQGKNLLTVSKKLHAHYSNLHKVYKRFESFNLLPETL